MELKGSRRGQTITSARSTRLGADYSYEDSGSCVSGEEEGGIVCAPPLLPLLLHSAHHKDSIYIMTLGNWNGANHCYSFRAPHPCAIKGVEHYIFHVNSTLSSILYILYQQ